MILRLILWLFGYLGIEVPSSQPEAFINASLQHHFDLWSVRRTANGLTAFTRYREYGRVREVARTSRIRPRIRSRHGLPFLWRRVLRRRWMLAGPFLFLAVLYLVTSFIWFVEVKGNEQVSPVTVAKTAAELGLAPGVWREALDPAWISRMLPLKLPELSWASVEIRGTRAIIHIAEKRALDEEQKPDLQPAHIAASKPGKILRITTQMGSPLVQKGDRVQAGQILISGFMRSETNAELEAQPNSLLYPGQWVHAEGQILAEVTYEQTIDLPLRQDVWLPSGVEYQRYLLQLGGWQWTWGKEPDKSKHRSEKTVWIPAPWRNSILPVEMTTVHVQELRSSLRVLTPEEALQQADLRAWAALLDRIPPQARIVSRERIEVERSPASVRVTWRVVTEEEIGSLQPLTGDFDVQENPLNEHLFETTD